MNADTRFEVAPGSSELDRIGLFGPGPSPVFCSFDPRVAFVPFSCCRSFISDERALDAGAVVGGVGGTGSAHSSTSPSLKRSEIVTVYVRGFSRGLTSTPIASSTWTVSSSNFLEGPGGKGTQRSAASDAGFTGIGAKLAIWDVQLYFSLRCVTSDAPISCDFGRGTRMLSIWSKMRFTSCISASSSSAPVPPGSSKIASSKNDVLWISLCSCLVTSTAWSVSEPGFEPVGDVTAAFTTSIAGALATAAPGPPVPHAGDGGGVSGRL